jgi:formylglycine-generating enzyme required for sulfatase activity
LHDVHGNVWEWVEDCWNDGHAGAPTDGGAWTTDDCTRRVLRGGSWNILPGDVRSAIRIGYDTGNRYNYLGFRIAKKLP